MAHYIYLENSKLNGAGQCRIISDSVTNIEVTEDLYKAYCETPNKYIYTEGEITVNPDYEKEQAQKERERLNNLSMTRGDVFEALILAKGIAKADVRAMIENADLDSTTKLLYLNRFDEALEFYRGYPIFDMLGAQLDITSDMLDKFFETKDYHELIAQEGETDE